MKQLPAATMLSGIGTDTRDCPCLLYTSTGGIHPADGAIRRNQHIAGMQIAEDAVSYTHLDVYKRQCQNQHLNDGIISPCGGQHESCCTFCIFRMNICPGINQYPGNSIMSSHRSPYKAVSYTHLDVYKRQLQKVGGEGFFHGRLTAVLSPPPGDVEGLECGVDGLADM